MEKYEDGIVMFISSNLLDVLTLILQFSEGLLQNAKIIE